MSLLTEQEAAACAYGEITPQLCEDMWPFARAIEQAVLQKLAAGVSVEPYATLHHDDGHFTTKQREHDLRYIGPVQTDVFAFDQLQAAYAAARARAINECADIVEDADTPDCGGWTAQSIADVIRALLGETKC